MTEQVVRFSRTIAAKDKRIAELEAELAICKSNVHSSNKLAIKDLQELGRLQTLRPAAEWTPEDGRVIWWFTILNSRGFGVGSIGSYRPLGCQYFTPIPVPVIKEEL